MSHVWVLVLFVVLVILRVFLIFVHWLEISDNVRFSDVYQKAVSEFDLSLKFGEGSVTFSQVSDFVLKVHWIKLNVKLSSLMSAARSTHHRVDWWLVLADICWVVRVIHRNDKVVHLHLVILIIFVPEPVFNSEVSVTIVLLSARLLSFVINAKWVDGHNEVLLEMGWAQDFELECRILAGLYDFLKLLLSHLEVLSFDLRSNTVHQGFSVLSSQVWRRTRVVVLSPLSSFLILYHILHIFLHRLGQFATCVQRSAILSLLLWVAVIFHATSTSKVGATQNHSRLKLKIKFCWFDMTYMELPFLFALLSAH